MDTRPIQLCRIAAALVGAWLALLAATSPGAGLLPLV